MPARMLRDCSGDLCLSVERFLSCSVNDSDDESDSVLSPPRRFFSPPQSVREEVVDSVDRLSGVDSCDEASVEEWNEVCRAAPSHP